ncbi:MAG: hypothetical protein ABJC10_02625 [Acidobacteriota bacterium]
MRKPRRVFPAITIISVLLGFAASVFAQSDPRNPAMASQRFDNDKEYRFARFSEYKKSPSPDQQKRAYLAAKSYLLLYAGDNDPYAKEAKQFVIEFDRKVSQSELYPAFDSKNYVKAFELGRPLLKTDPENFFVLGLLSEAGYDNSLAGDASLNDETIGYLRRAIELVEAGKSSKPDPFKNLETAAGFLNFVLGSLLKDKSPVEAAAAFVKAIQSKSPYENDPLTYYRLGVATLNGPYTKLSAEYNDKYGSKQTSPEQQAMLEEINRLGTRAISAYARAVALSDPQRPATTAPLSQFTPEFRSKVLAQLTGLYKSFHNDSDVGLNDLIATVLSTPLP